MKRIEAAGGFVNAVGRVNGNLNLSRSLGDLKYKQVPYVPPADQVRQSRSTGTVTTIAVDETSTIDYCIVFAVVSCIAVS